MMHEKEKQTLLQLGAIESDVDTLLIYTENAFKPCAVENDNTLSPKWPMVWEKAQAVCETMPRLEMFPSPAGTIPIIYTDNSADFENLIRELVYNGKDTPNLGSMGASFVYGKTLRFIILSNKSYSGISAADMGLDEAAWVEKSITIRKHHECAHYYTKRFLGSSRNNLHDELIADFCGLYAAFGEYRAEWFLLFWDSRFRMYTENLTHTSSDVIRRLAAAAADGVERWTKTGAFLTMNESERIEYLAKKNLLFYANDCKESLLSASK